MLCGLLLLALACISVQVVVGVVFCPILDELFVATRGNGATLNGRPISVSRVESLSDALFCTEIGVTRDSETVKAIFSRIAALTQQVLHDIELVLIAACFLEIARHHLNSHQAH